MPTNPFGGIGSRGDEKNIADQTRALRAYEQARKRLISSMKGEERAVTGLAAAHSAAMSKRSRDATAYERELARTSGLLSAQGATLKNLDATRDRFHREEMDRSQSLLQRYEGIKQALLEIQEDSDDTRTLLGSIIQPFKAGIDNMLKFGNLPKVTQPIRDTAIDVDDVTGSLERSAGATEDLGRAMVDVAPTVWKYRTALVDLDAELKGLKVKYADAGDGTEKLAQQFIVLSKTDMIDPGAVKKVTAVTDSLKYLEAQGVSTETSLGLLVERSRKSGRTFEESAQNIEQVSAQADLLRESISGTDNVLQGFAFTVRDDFVRAIADATRNLDSQVVSIENVSAAYAYAAKQASEYGLSAEGTEKVSKAFAGMFFRERDDAAGFLSGEILSKNLAKSLKDAEEAIGATYDTASEQQKKLIEDRVGQGAGIEDRATIRQSISTLGEGLGPLDLRNMLAGTTAAIKADLDAQMEKMGISKINDTSVSSRLLSSINGFEELNTLQKRTLSDILQSEGTGAAAEEIKKMQEQALQKAEEMKGMTSSALTAVLTFKDPIQQLFNIKDFLKSIMLNVSNIVKLVSQIPGLGGVRNLYEDSTGESLKKDYAAAAVEAGLEATDSNRKKLLEDLAEAQSSYDSAETDGARERRKADLDSITAALEDNSKKRGDLERVRQEYEGLSGDAPSRKKGSTPDEGEGILSSIGDYASKARDSVTEHIGEFFGFGEEGRTAGVEMARKASAPAQSAGAGAGFVPSNNRAARGAPGEMEADGDGEVSVNTSGESIMTVRMKIKNMGEVIAHHSSTEARVYDQYGLSG